MGNWTCFSLLGVAAILVAFLWYKLGSSSEYRETVQDGESEIDSVAAEDVKDGKKGIKVVSD